MDDGNRDCLFVCWALEAGTRALAWGNETKDSRGEVVLQPRSGLRDSWMRILTLKRGIRSVIGIAYLCVGP